MALFLQLTLGSRLLTFTPLAWPISFLASFFYIIVMPFGKSLDKLDSF
jgi:hypothetical protein